MISTGFNPYEVCLPFDGTMKITSIFGNRPNMEGKASTYHLGWDVVGLGTKTVVAVGSGTIVSTKMDSSNTGFGNRVWLQTDTGYSIVFGHLESISCKEGQRVTCKTPIGIMGHTGNCIPKGPGGTHLHIGIFSGETRREDKSKAVDPAIFFGILNNYDLKGKVLDGSSYVSWSSKIYSSEEAYDEGVTGEYSVGVTLDYSEVYTQTVEGSEQYSDILYGRKYKISILDDEGGLIDVSNLRCTFSIIKSWTGATETSELTIYNLSANTENKIRNKAKKIYIEAGYTGLSSFGLIFVGEVIQCIRSKESGTDMLLTIVMGDSTRFVATSVLGTTISSERNMRQVINDSVSKAGLITKENYGISVGKLTSKADEFTFPRGKVLFGRTSKLLDQISKSLNSTMYIEDGTINFADQEDIASDRIFVIGPDSGMIGLPNQLQYGVSLRCLINPQLKLNSLFKIDNTIVNTYRFQLGENYLPLDPQGIYKIIKLTYSGDTRGQDWYVDIDALNQIGTIPEISQNAFSRN